MLCRCGKFVAFIGPQPKSDIGRYGLLRAAQQAPHRRVVKFAFDIPKRDIDGAYGEVPNSGVRTGVKFPEHLMHQALILQGIFAD